MSHVDITWTLSLTADCLCVKNCIVSHMFTIILKVMELFLTRVFYNVSYLHTENISHYEATAIA